MDFKAFDTTKIDEYARQAREQWGDTEAWKQYERKSAGRGREQEQLIGRELMAVIAQFHGLIGQPADGPEAAAQVKALQQFITAHYYECTPQILRGLGQMYGSGGSFTESIDAACGAGTAAYAAAAIEACTR